MENPNVLSAYERFKAKNFTVLGVSLDRSRDAWIKAIEDDKLVWSQVSDLKFWNNAVALQYRIQQIPQNFLIDPNGKIVGKNLRGADLDSKLCALLGCN
jgi:peroxiredoxin